MNREPLSAAVRNWAAANGGELNRIQVRELLRELERVEATVRDLCARSGGCLP